MGKIYSKQMESIKEFQCIPVQNRQFSLTVYFEILLLILSELRRVI